MPTTYGSRKQADAQVQARGRLPEHTSPRILDWLAELPIAVSPPQERGSLKRKRKPSSSHVIKQSPAIQLTSPPASDSGLPINVSKIPWPTAISQTSIMASTGPTASAAGEGRHASKRRRLSVAASRASGETTAAGEDEALTPSPVDAALTPEPDLTCNESLADVTPRPPRASRPCADGSAQEIAESSSPHVRTSRSAAASAPRSYYVSASASESASASASTSISAASGASPSRKRLSALRLDPEGLERRPLVAAARQVPQALLALNSDIALIGSGHGVVHPSSVPGRQRNRVQPWAFAQDSERRARLGPCPSLRQVRTIMSDAAHADSLCYLEHGWNCTVYAMLLKVALDIGCAGDGDDGENDGDDDTEEKGRGRDGDYERTGALGIDPVTSRTTPMGVDFIPCTTAKIIREYVPTAAAPKMIDFAIVLAMPNLESGRRARIQQLCADSPLGCINHTDFGPLSVSPIAISIETKKPGRGSGDDEAQPQIGVWQTSQCRQLANLVRSASPSCVDAHDNHSSLSDEITSAWVESALSALPLLPAIIISGHDWSFAASTREGSKTILWTDTCFGSTKTIEGVYSIIMGVQRLAQWTRECFLPWYQDFILEPGLAR